MNQTGLANLCSSVAPMEAVQVAPFSGSDLNHCLDHGAEIWPLLTGARLFMTGATGFVGKWLLASLIAANRRLGIDARAVVLTRDVARLHRGAPWIAAAGEITLAEGDVRDFEFPHGAFSHVIHAASDMSATASPLTVHDVIVQGTRHVLDFAVQRGARDFLLISSGAIYGPQPAGVKRLDENFPGAPPLREPRSAYGQGKREAEWLTQAIGAEFGVACRIARLFAFSGPGLPLDAGYAVGNFVRDLLARRPITVGGDGTAERSYLYAADLAVWLWTILLRGAPAGIYNVGGTEIVNIGDLARLIAGLAEPALQVVIAAQAKPNAPVVRYIPCTERATRELLLKPHISLEEGVRRMIGWHRLRCSQ